MKEEIRQRFSEHFLSNVENLIALIETSIDQPVDKLLVVTIYLDENVEEMLECIFLSNGKWINTSIKIDEHKEMEEN